MSFENETVLFYEPERTAELAVLVVPQGTEAEWCCGNISWWNGRTKLEERMLVQAISDRKPGNCGLTNELTGPAADEGLVGTGGLVVESARNRPLAAGSG